MAETSCFNRVKLDIDQSAYSLILMSRQDLSESLKHSDLRIQGLTLSTDYPWKGWKNEFSSGIQYLEEYPGKEYCHFWLILKSRTDILGVVICKPDSSSDFLESHSGGIINIEYEFFNKARQKGLGRLVVNRLSRFISDAGGASSCLLSIGFERTHEII